MRQSQQHVIARAASAADEKRNQAEEFYARVLEELRLSPDPATPSEVQRSNTLLTT